MSAIAENMAEAGGIAAFAIGIVLVNSGRALAAALRALERARKLAGSCLRALRLSGWRLPLVLALAGAFALAAALTAGFLGSRTGALEWAARYAGAAVLLAAWCAASARPWRPKLAVLLARPRVMLAERDDMRPRWTRAELAALDDKADLGELLSALPRARHERRLP